MGCAASQPDPATFLVAQASAEKPLVAGTSGASALALERKDEGKSMMSPPKAENWQVAGATVMVASRDRNAYYAGFDKGPATVTFSDADGKVVAAISCGERGLYQKGRSRSVLFAAVPCDGATGHETKTMDGGVTLHAVAEIRTLGGSYSAGMGLFAASQNGTFASTPALTNQWGRITNSKGEGVALFPKYAANKVTCAAGVDPIPCIALHDEFHMNHMGTAG